MTTNEAIALLKSQGYSVRAPGAARASTGKRAGKAHEHCIEHHKLAGYSKAVCVQEGQAAEDVLGFAADVLAIGADAGDVLAMARARDYGAQGVRVAA